MIYINDQIIAYLTVNDIAYTTSDYMTGQPEGQPDQILQWNAEKLGTIPTQEQLDSAWTVYEGHQIAAQNKETASQLLSETDWTAQPSVANPDVSNPYLSNQNEFLAYRNQVRQIAVSPPTTPAVFPEKPTSNWQSAQA